jgi:hypothetical protein
MAEAKNLRISYLIKTSGFFDYYVDDIICLYAHYRGSYYVYNISSFKIFFYNYNNNENIMKKYFIHNYRSGWKELDIEKIEIPNYKESSIYTISDGSCYKFENFLKLQGYLKHCTLK